MVAGEATDPLPYTSIMQLGGWPLELAPYCCVQLTPPPPKKRAWTLAVWRVNKAPAGLRPTPGADDAVEIEGEVVAASVYAARYERGLYRADAEITVEGGAGDTPFKLWFPREAALRARWEAALAMFGAAAPADAPPPPPYWIEDVARKLAEDALPAGWSCFRDPSSGSDYFASDDGEATWTRPLTEDVGAAAKAPPPATSLAVAWLLQKALGDEVDAMLDEASDDAAKDADAPVLRGLLGALKRCPLVASDDWPKVVDDLCAQMPKLLAKAEALEAGPGGAGLPEERGARYHLLQGAAQPLFYLSAGERAGADAGDSYEARLQARCRGAAGELAPDVVFDAITASPDASDLPDVLRCVLDAAKPLVVLRLGRKLRPRTERLRAARGAFDAFPRRTVVAALRVGAFPSSPSFVQGLVELMVKTKLTRSVYGSYTETIAQSSVRASLGLDDLKPCEGLASDTAAKVAGATDAALETLAATCEEHERDAVERACALEGYRRKAEALVAAYGDEDYVDLVCTLHPALFEPVAQILTDASVRAADAVEDLLTNWGAALDDATDDYVTALDRVILLEQRISKMLDAALGLVHRAARRDRGRWDDSVKWILGLVHAFQLDLDADVDDCADDLAALERAHGACEGDLSLLGAVDCPGLRAKLPGFVAELRASWSARSAAARAREADDYIAT